MTDNSGRAPTGQALAVPAEPVSRLGPSGLDPSRKTVRSVAAAPFSVYGQTVTSLQIADAIDRLANVRAEFPASDLAGGVLPGAKYIDKQEALNRLFQRWRKLGLVEFGRGKWRLTQGSWDKLQAIAIEARRAVNAEGGAVACDESAGRNGIAQNQSECEK